MSTCALCETRPVNHLYIVYTAIEESSSTKTGFKEYVVKTRTYGFQPHKYGVCDDCKTRYGRIYPLIIWVPTVLWVLFVIFTGDFSNSTARLDTCAFLVAPFLIAAYYLSRWLFGIEGKLIKKAVAARKDTNWRQFSFGTLNTQAEIKGFTQAQFEKVKNKQKR